MSVDGGGFDASDAVSLAGHGGGGVGEEGVAEGAPAGAGVGEVGDQDGGFFLVFVGQVVVFGAAPDDPVVAQDAEGDGVPAGLGEEVAAEAEHVGPFAQSPVRALVLFAESEAGDVAAEAPAGVDQSFDVAAVGVRVEIDGLTGQPGGDVAGGFGGFGGVLGEVAGDHLVGDGPIAGDADGPDVELLAPGDVPAGRVEVVGFGGEGGVAGGVFDGVDQVEQPDPGRWRDDRVEVVGVDAVEADDGVEVHDSASLHFGDLAVGESDGRRVDAEAAGARV